MTDLAAESLSNLILKWRDRINELRRAADLNALMEAAEAAADELELRAGECLDPVGIEALKAARRFTYNASADCWPGWVVPKSWPNPHILERALKLAERSVRLVQKLGLGGLQEGTGVWLCGAHEFALERYSKAHTKFILAREYYIAAQAPGLTLLTEGYIAILCEIAGAQVPRWPANLDEVCARISTGAFEDGPEWIEQLHTARQAFTWS